MYNDSDVGYDGYIFIFFVCFFHLVHRKNRERRKQRKKGREKEAKRGKVNEARERVSLGKHSITFFFILRLFVYVYMRMVFSLFVVCAIIMCICKKKKKNEGCGQWGKSIVHGKQQQIEAHPYHSLSSALRPPSLHPLSSPFSSAIFGSVLICVSLWERAHGNATQQ